MQELLHRQLQVLDKQLTPARVLFLATTIYTCISLPYEDITKLAKIEDPRSELLCVPRASFVSGCWSLRARSACEARRPAEHVLGQRQLAGREAQVHGSGLAEV